MNLTDCNLVNPHHIIFTSTLAESFALKDYGFYTASLALRLLWKG